MGKKEFTKKQLRKGLKTLNEASLLKKDMKKSFDALKKLDTVMTGQKIGDVTITKAMNKKIKNAKRYIEDLWDKITDGEIEEKETEDDKKVEEKNEQSEGYGKMYNALEGIREGKIIKMNEATLKRIVERVVLEGKKRLSEDSEGEETYHYGEDEGEDRKEEGHLEHEKDMAPSDRIGEIQKHLDALKKDMGYDEEHEDREEEGTHFEGRRPKKVIRERK